MDKGTFMKVVELQHGECVDILNAKRQDHRQSKDDRLLQFKEVAILLGTDQVDALKSMLVKHTTQLYGMLRNWRETSIEEWDEIIRDNINYMHLLKGIIIEEFEGMDLVKE
ncbi:hypothetical protein KAR91_34705 [Candidatus Pacearchaeota archaeon]|nr:hypothetical protein [Candidatus Pacearchaeota archaeon]